MRYALDELGVLFKTRAEDWPQTPLAEIPLLELLLVSTPRYAMQIDDLLHRTTSTHDSPLPMHVVIANSLSRTAMQAIERVACDLVLHSPVHPTLLQLAIRRAVFQGRERRGKDRVAIGAPVKFREWLRSYPATLVDLSPGGCKLSSQYSVAVDESITLVLPRELTNGKAVSLKGRIVAGHDAGFQDLSEHAMSVVFSALEPEQRKTIADVISKCGVGATSKLEAPSKMMKRARQSGPPLAPGTRRSGGDRRLIPRKQFYGNALLKLKSRTVPLIGRDLSPLGLRVEQHPDLEMGDKIELILYGKTGAAPIALQASVTRNDGSDGLTLMFKKPSEKMQRQLEALVDGLPTSDRRDGPGTLIAEMKSKS